MTKSGAIVRQIFFLEKGGCGYSFFISPVEKITGSVNDKCLTGAKRKEFKELIREIVFTLFCSSNPRWKTPPGEGGFVGLTLFQKWQGLFFLHLI